MISPCASIRTLLREMHPDDAELAAAIFAADAPDVPGLIRAYYADMDRAERTPRGILYLHMGWLLGRLDSYTQGVTGTIH